MARRMLYQVEGPSSGVVREQDSERLAMPALAPVPSAAGSAAASAARAGPASAMPSTAEAHAERKRPDPRATEAGTMTHILLENTRHGPTDPAMVFRGIEQRTVRGHAVNADEVKIPTWPSTLDPRQISIYAVAIRSLIIRCSNGHATWSLDYQR